jgi:anti-anti-sigma factor
LAVAAGGRYARGVSSAFGIHLFVRDDDTALVRIHGELDAFTATTFRAALEDASTHANVVVDLCEVSYVSAEPIGILIGCTTRATRGRFAVAAAPESWPRRVMRLCVYPYPIAESLDDALRGLGLPYRKFPRVAAPALILAPGAAGPRSCGSARRRPSTRVARARRRARSPWCG